MMAKRSSDARRQLFNRKSTNLEASSSNLLSRTLKKNTDRYINKNNENPEFVIHKTTNSEDYEIFNSRHPIRQSKLQAFEKKEQTYEDIFRAGFDDSGSEDEEPDISSIAASPSSMNQDNILISVPGYTKEEVTVSKRLNYKDQRNVRLSRVSQLDRAFEDRAFMRGLSQEELQQYEMINAEHMQHLEILKRQLAYKPEDLEDSQDPDRDPFEVLSNAAKSMEEDSWMYK